MVQVFQLIRKQLFACVKVVLSNLSSEDKREEVGSAYCSPPALMPHPLTANAPPPHSVNPIVSFLAGFTNNINGVKSDIAICTKC